MFSGRGSKCQSGRPPPKHWQPNQMARIYYYQRPSESGPGGRLRLPAIIMLVARNQEAPAGGAAAAGPASSRGVDVLED